MEANGRREVGFDAEVVDAWLGLTPQTTEKLAGTNPEDCLHHDASDEQCER